MAQQVQRHSRNARRKALRIDLAPFNPPTQHLIDSERLLPAAQEFRTQVGRRPSGLGEVLAHLHTDQDRYVAAAGRGVPEVRVATVQWVTTAYLLALGMAVPVTGWLIDRLGGKRLWIGALTLFLVASLGASLAWNAPSLIACRVVQGIGGGLMLPVLTTLLVQAADGRSLGRSPRSLGSG